MSDPDTVFSSFSRTYRPWGQVRRKNLAARMVHGMVMTVVGLGILAMAALLVVFVGVVAVAGLVALTLMAVMAAVMRKPIKVAVRTPERADGVLEARKKGSTWTVY